MNNEIEKNEFEKNEIEKNESKKKDNKSTPIWDAFDLLEVFIYCTAAIVIIFSLFARLTIVSGQSMEDTLQDRDFLVVSDLMYTPTQGDIVVIHDVSKYDQYAKPLVKRVIATGGQTVTINYDTWEVRVDGEVIDEPYRALKGSTAQSGIETFNVGEHEVFVMGDNRNHSGDSRFIGPIDERCIVGKAYIRVMPFNKFGSLSIEATTK